MPYQFCDVDGEVNVAGPTIRGYSELVQLVKADPKNFLYPEVLALVGTGISHNPLVLATEVTQLWDKSTNKDIRSILSNMADAARRSKGFLSLVM